MKLYKEKRQELSPEAQARISAGAQEIRNEIRILRAIREYQIVRLNNGVC